MSYLTGFAKIKWEVGQIQWAYLGMNEARTAIEANPATHRIAIYIEKNYIPRPEHEGIVNGIEEGSECWKADYENCKFKFDLVIKALKELVELKNIKETAGETEDYLKRKTKAWREARTAVEAFGIASDPQINHQTPLQ
jgi:hypothetical protein